MKDGKKHNKLSYLCIFILLSLSVYLFVNKESRDAVCDNNDLSHLNPQIVCIEKQVVNKRNYVVFKRQLQEFIKKSKERGDSDLVSVYFRDLQYGPTFGVDEYEKFSPASLLKLPMMIAYLAESESESESESSILNTKIFFQGYNNDITQSIPPTKSAKENTNYTIYELLEFLIKYSDNNSYYALLAYLNKISTNTQILRDTFIDLGVIDPKSNLDETITVKSYAGIFTQLFNSSYFTKKETSEMALELLTDTDYHSGIVAGVPVSLKVAHKFGERFDESTNLKQLHDCGIVYYPQNPYLLCVMTKGDDIDKLASVIAKVSEMVYKEFDARKI